MKYHKISQAPFYSTFNSFHCFLPDGVLVLFNKAFDTALSMEAFCKGKIQSARSEKFEEIAVISLSFI